MQFNTLKLAVLVASAIAGGGCSLLKKDRPVTPVLGERIAVLTNEVDVMVDAASAAVPVSLPVPVANTEWAQSGGNASKSMGHLALGNAINRAWTVSIGRGTSVKARLGAPPVVGAGRVYTIDTTATVRAFDERSGGMIWEAAFGREKGNEASLYGGGIAFVDGRVYATNGLGFVAAFDASTGKIVWQVRPAGPLRGSPTVASGAVYVMSQDNQIYSLKTTDGSTNWNQAASLEIAGVFGTASPAFARGTVVAGFSSGELNAYRYENGRPVWQDALARTSIRTSVSRLSDVDADPVIDSGQVIAIGQGGRMVALELISGQRQWELNVAGISTPWVAGDWAFAVLDDGKLINVSRSTGKIRWIGELQAYRNVKRKAGPISYSGPILAGNRLVLTRTSGQIVFADPRNGNVIGGTDLGAPISLSPVVANSTLYVLDDDGRLHAFR